MFNRFAALCLVLGAAGGYALGAPAITAQNVPDTAVPVFVSPGDDVTVQFERGAYTEGPYSLRCTVAEIRGVWFRCERDKFATERDEKWHSLQRAFAITRRER